MYMAVDDQESECVYSQTVRDLHNEMITILDDEIAPLDGMKDTWDKLLQLFSNGAPLSTKQINSIKKIGDLFDLLMKDKYISFENYEPFAKKLEKVHKAMASRVRSYSDQIKKQITKERESLR
ncbi:uncharacterized protein LOC110463461 isoform X2 [Mizuhopecten yessoensis]|nr:uncharacterized protein LOC110463461 isoform X2 [Mizuhopecten yessoensis]XP_021373754.1 uncharacterized protein LOC110463461 isoform X2 [Mizuhopecten yessoensis]XP_021373755.1 uncharacterized protein LOC110463461 isoform X2 [Mizuhopecten yessoensis]